jgi:3,4-dihydroxy 2-butanone 4-phosphate synthase/GTP cyclohydrolase II
MKDSISNLRRRYESDGKIHKQNVKWALDDILAGTPIIIVDDFTRENEGDLMIAAEKATIENIAFMCRYGRGIMCLPVSGYLLDRLEVPMMVQNSTDPLDTPFTVSVDAKKGVTTGVSAGDRLATIKTMLDPAAKPEDLTRPGHLFPLRARDKLLLERRGHTEVSVVLTKILGMVPLAVISEIMNFDGSMSRLPNLDKLAYRHDLQMVSIEDICEELNLGKNSN